MKKIKLILLPVLTTLPLVAMSAKIDDNNLKIDEEKQKKYALYDFIKLIGRQDAEIIKSYKITSWIPSISSGKMFWFKDKGYSIISDIDYKIYEVNPDIKLSSFNYLEATRLNYHDYGSFSVAPKYENRDKPWPGDHKREKKQKSNDFTNFKDEDLEMVRTVKTKEEFEKYKIKPEKNGLIYADKEVENSWWFKTGDYNTFGYNSDENSYNPNESEEHHYFKQFTPYYINKENYLKSSSGGICGYVAINMLIMYNEFFEGSGYLNEWEKSKFLDLKDSLFEDNWSLKYNINNNVSPRLDDEFLKYLYQKTWFGNGVNYWWHAKYIAESILRNKWSNSKINYSYWGDDNLNSAWSSVYKYKKPTALGCCFTGVQWEDDNNKFWNNGHVVVAYGAYDDGRFLCNYGWGSNYSQMIITKYSRNKYDYNFAINNKFAGKLEKVFNFNGNKYTGIEITNLLRDGGYIK